MCHTTQSPSRRLRVRLTLLLLTGLLGAGSAAASDSEAQLLHTLQQQLQQMQAALGQLSEENRALRDHEQEVDRKLAEILTIDQVNYRLSSVKSWLISGHLT